MSFWELHKNLGFVLGGFFVLLAGLWLFLLSGYAQEEAASLSTYTGTYEKKITEYSQGEIPVKMSIRELKRINQKLQTEYTRLQTALHFPFTSPLIPTERMSHHQSYTRLVLAGLKKDIQTEFVQSRGIAMGEEAQTLGFDIPPEANETLEEDYEWLKQMEIIRHFFYTVLRAMHREAKSGALNLQRIDRVQPRPPLEVTDSIREYPLEITCQMTLRGVMRLLKICEGSHSDKISLATIKSGVKKNALTKARAKIKKRDSADDSRATFYTIMNLEIDGQPSGRTEKLRRRKVFGKPQEKLQREYFYQVTFLVSRLTIQEDMQARSDQPAQKTPPPAARYITPIPH